MLRYRYFNGSAGLSFQPQFLDYSYNAALIKLLQIYHVFRLALTFSFSR
jgi:hypothetical protein